MGEIELTQEKIDTKKLDFFLKEILDTVFLGLMEEENLETSAEVAQKILEKVRTDFLKKLKNSTSEKGPDLRRLEFFLNGTYKYLTKPSFNTRLRRFWDYLTASTPKTFFPTNFLAPMVDSALSLSSESESAEFLKNSIQALLLDKDLGAQEGSNFSVLLKNKIVDLYESAENDALREYQAKMLDRQLTETRIHKFFLFGGIIGTLFTGLSALGLIAGIAFPPLLAVFFAILAGFSSLLLLSILHKNQLIQQKALNSKFNIKIINDIKARRVIQDQVPHHTILEETKDKLAEIFKDDLKNYDQKIRTAVIEQLSLNLCKDNTYTKVLEKSNSEYSENVKFNILNFLGSNQKFFDLQIDDLIATENRKRINRLIKAGSNILGSQNVAIKIFTAIMGAIIFLAMKFGAPLILLATLFIPFFYKVTLLGSMAVISLLKTQFGSSDEMKKLSVMEKLKKNIQFKSMSLKEKNSSIFGRVRFLKTDFIRKQKKIKPLVEMIIHGKIETHNKLKNNEELTKMISAQLFNYHIACADEDPVGTIRESSSIKSIPKDIRHEKEKAFLTLVSNYQHAINNISDPELKSLLVSKMALVVFTNSEIYLEPEDQKKYIALVSDQMYLERISLNETVSYTNNVSEYLFYIMLSLGLPADLFAIAGGLLLIGSIATPPVFFGIIGAVSAVALIGFFLSNQRASSLTLKGFQIEEAILLLDRNPTPASQTKSALTDERALEKFLQEQIDLNKDNTPNDFLEKLENKLNDTLKATWSLDGIKTSLEEIVKHNEYEENRRLIEYQKEFIMPSWLKKTILFALMSISAFLAIAGVSGLAVFFPPAVFLIIPIIVGIVSINAALGREATIKNEQMVIKFKENQERIDQIVQHIDIKVKEKNRLENPSAQSESALVAEKKELESSPFAAENDSPKLAYKPVYFIDRTGVASINENTMSNKWPAEEKDLDDKCPDLRKKDDSPFFEEAAVNKNSAPQRKL